MANAVYPLFKTSLLSADTNVALTFNTSTDGPYCALMSSTYAYSAAHQFMSSLSSPVGTDQRITSPTVTTGTFSGANLTYTSVSGNQITQFAIYRMNNGANTTWRLVVFFDTSVTGLPLTPNGGNITVTWNGSGIFTISDMRVKKNIIKLGKIGPLNLVAFKFVWGSPWLAGLLAQDVQQKLPDAVEEIDGVLCVDYERAIEWAVAA